VHGGEANMWNERSLRPDYIHTTHTHTHTHMHNILFSGCDVITYSKQVPT